MPKTLYFFLDFCFFSDKVIRYLKPYTTETMFIRKTNHQEKKTKKKYSTFKLVESVRTENGPRQKTILNLGSKFELPKEKWKDLANRINQILTKTIQHTFIEDSEEIIILAKRYSKEILKKQAQVIDVENCPPEEQSEFHEVDILSMKHDEVRTIGTEHVLLNMIQELELDKKLREMRFTKEQVQLAIGTIVNRAASPGSERSADNWLKGQSGLGDLIDFDFGKTSLYKMYKISDLLLAGKKPLEEYLAETEKNLFNLEETLILYDLTNTYFEGSARQNPKAKFGRSKEKRTDCPLVTMGLTLNGEGFPKKSDFFEGNASESKTLAMMIETMQDKSLTSKPVVVMDAGIATEDNILWLIENGYNYLVVSRKSKTSMPDGVETEVVKEEPNNTVEVAIVDVENHYYITDAAFQAKLSSLGILPETLKKLNKIDRGIFHDEKVFLRALKKALGKFELKKYRDLLLKTAKKPYNEKELYCFLEARAQKEQSMKTRIQKRFEVDLEHLRSGLIQKGRIKNYEKVTEKIGRLKEKYKGISSHYDFTIEKEKNGENASSIKWALREKKAEDRFSGVYCLRTSLQGLDEKNLWKTYIMLTEVEEAFRCMKSELGLRPVHHQLEHRVDGHLFITLLAYHLIHSIRFRLKQHGITDSWKTIRDRLSNQVRLTTSMKRKDGKIIYLRKSSEANTFQQKIYNALGVPLNPGKTEKTILTEKKNM